MWSRLLLVSGIFALASACTKHVELHPDTRVSVFTADGSGAVEGAKVVLRSLTRPHAAERKVEVGTTTTDGSIAFKEVAQDESTNLFVPHGAPSYEIQICVIKPGFRTLLVEFPTYAAPANLDLRLHPGESVDKCAKDVRRFYAAAGRDDVTQGHDLWEAYEIWPEKQP
jgi:hypothetical protein